MSDGGNGMREGVRKPAFAPFLTTEKSGVGVALGLSMVRDYVENTGGYHELLARN